MTVSKSGAELFAEAKGRIQEIAPADAVGLARGDGLVFLDVREPNEWNLGHVPGALHVARGLLEGKVEAVVSREVEVIVYCASGNRSALAAETLAVMGYGRVRSLKDGFRGWTEAGGEVED